MKKAFKDVAMKTHTGLHIVGHPRDATLYCDKNHIAWLGMKHIKHYIRPNRRSVWVDYRV